MSDDKKNSRSRRDVIRTMFQATGYVGVGGLLWGRMGTELSASDLVLRPPAAIKEKDFLKACLNCGACVEACPYDSLKLARPEDNITPGTPFFEPRDVPCHMCSHIPCVTVCHSGALDILNVKKDDIDEMNINLSKMGTAVIHKESCIAFLGIQCDACYSACPLMDEAIVLKYEKNERTGKHTLLLPVINSNICTGCGLCEHACVTENPAVKVLPVEIAHGEVGSYNIKGWGKKEENIVEDVEVEENDDYSGTIDYLNDIDGL